MSKSAAWCVSRVVILLAVVAFGLGGTSWGLATHDPSAGAVAMALAEPFPAGDTLVRRSITDSAGDPLVYLPIVTREWPPVPEAPQLEPIVNPYGESSYLVLWSSSFLATYYVLEEATDSAFGDAHEVFVGLGLLYSVVGKAPGHYYYRVKAVHTTGTAFYQGPWSNTVHTHVTAGYTYQDDFSSTASGWPHRVFDLDGHPILSTFYLDGAYYMRILIDAGLSQERMGIVPAPYEHFDDTYDVEVNHTFRQVSDTPPDWAKASLVFSGDLGADGYFESVYAIEWNFEGNCAVSAYTGSYMDSFIPAVPVPDRIYQGWVHCPSITPGENHNVHALAEVRGDQVTIYLNGGLIGTFSPIGGQSHVGLITGAWQAVPVESRFDDFRVTDR